MSQLDIRRGAYLQVLDSVAIREREDVTSRGIGEVTKGVFVKVLDVGEPSGKAGPRVLVRVLGPGISGGSQEGWISSTTKSGRPLVGLRSAFDLKAANVTDEPVRETAAAPSSLQHLLQNLDRTEEGERANMTPQQRQAEAEEARSSFAALARGRAPKPTAAAEAPPLASDPRAARTAAAAAAEAARAKAAQATQKDKEVFIPKFMLIEQPDPEYTAEVYERRVRLMQQEKARRQARNRARGRPVKEEDEVPFPIPPAPAYPSRMQPAEPPKSPWERRSQAEAAQDELAEKVAEAAFASRAARLVREQAGSVGQRRAPEPERVAERSLPSAKNHDFTGVWVDISGNTHVLSQRGSIVTEKRGPGDPSSTGCGLAMRNELTMFGSIGTLSDNVLRWSDGSVWTRDTQEVSGKVSAPAGASLVKEVAPQRFDQRLPADLADLVSPGPDIPSTESDDLPFAPGRRRPEMTMSERETYLRQEKTGQSKGEQRLWFAPWLGDNDG